MSAGAPTPTCWLCEGLRPAVIEAIGKFEYDLAFTAPELFPMRIRQLKDRLADLLDGDPDD